MNLICTNNNQNIGTIKRNTIKTFTFDIYNNSDRIIKPDLYPGCGCTGVKLIDPILQPFSHSLLEVSMDANKSALGTWEKSIVISYLDATDLEQKNLQILFTVTITE
jgi:hypothetical protein